MTESVGRNTYDDRKTWINVGVSVEDLTGWGGAAANHESGGKGMLKQRSKREFTSGYGLEENNYTTTLPDGGTRAWLFMISACLIEAFLWGFTISYGIFFDYYKNRTEFRDSTLLATVGSCASGIPFLGAPLLTTAVSRWPQYQRQMIWFGTVLCIISLMGASFATQAWHLLLSQGIGYGLGVLIVYYPMLAMVNSWFTERRGLAYGVLFAATGASGTGLPFVIDALLNRFGYGWTLRGYSCAIIMLIIPTFPFCTSRPSTSRVPDAPSKPQWSILKNPALQIFSLANLFQGLAYYIPSLYLPAYASTLRLRPIQTLTLVALLNASQVIAQVLLGFTSDKTSVFALIPFSALGAALWTISLWYLGRSAATALAFSLLFGLFTGGWTSLWARFNMTLSRDTATQEFAYGLLAAQRGVGNVVAGPISARLLQLGAGESPRSSRMYGSLAVFVAVCMAFSSLGGLGGIYSKKRRDATIAAPSPSPAAGISRPSSVAFPVSHRYSGY